MSMLGFASKSQLLKFLLGSQKELPGVALQYLLDLI